MKTHGVCVGKGFLRKIVQMSRRNLYAALISNGKSPIRGSTTIMNDLHCLAKRDQKVIENTGPTIQHVKDGKPLTAHGAKLLGVGWP